MKKNMGAAFLAAVGLLLAGCSATNGSPQNMVTYSSPKKEAIQTLEYQGIVAIMRDQAGFYDSWSDSDIRASVDLTCNGFANRDSAEDIRDKVTATYGAPSSREAWEVQQIMSSAVGIHCEEYRTQRDTIRKWDVSPKQ